MTDPLEATAVVGSRLGRFRGRIRHLDVVTSTNDVALTLASAGAAEGTTIVADSQTAGRGRHGRAWLSPPMAGLYFSTILRPQLSLIQATQLTLTAAVAASEGLRSAAGIGVDIKWPNDLMLSGRKVGGILTETASTTTDAGPIVLGIGINVARLSRPPELATRAVSLEEELGRPIDRIDLLIEILAALEIRYRMFVDRRFEELNALWQRSSPSSVGVRIKWTSESGIVEGRTAGLDQDGALRVRVGDRIDRIIAGDVEWL